MRRSGIQIVLALPFLVGAGPSDAEVSWAVLPVRGEEPPPRDPTLLRLTKALGDAVHEATGEDVQVVSRELRDEGCPGDDGVCPRHVNSLFRARRVLSLVLLTGDPRRLSVRVFTEKEGLLRQGEVACQWEQGQIGCDKLGLQLLLAPPKADEKQAARGATHPATQKQVETAFKKLTKRIEKCKKQGYGELAAESRRAPSVQLRIDDHGRATEVRLEPAGILQAPAFSCMARLIESLALDPPSPGGGASFKFPLPE